jgi:hypothetical protein
MKYELLDVEIDTEICLIYIDDYDYELKKLIDDNFLEIIKGKLLAERETDDFTIDTLRDAAKYILKKDKTKSAKVGIIGEFLFHCFMRLNKVSSRFLSCCPTIGYSDTYQGFFKGFDGCYYSQNEIWITEVKSKEKSLNLDIDNKDKLTLAANQIDDEVNDDDINRWEKVKVHVYNQLTQKEIDDKKIHELLTQNSKNNYNKILCTMLICNSMKFHIDYIKTYLNKLKDQNVPNQKLFIMCIRNYDYDVLYNYISKKYGDANE